MLVIQAVNSMLRKVDNLVADETNLIHMYVTVIIIIIINIMIIALNVASNNSLKTINCMRLLTNKFHT